MNDTVSNEELMGARPHTHVVLETLTQRCEAGAAIYVLWQNLIWDCKSKMPSGVSKALMKCFGSSSSVVFSHSV